jgi:hypothetical protein
MGVCVLPRRGRPGAPLLHRPRRDVRLSLGPLREKDRGGGHCRGTREGQGWLGLFREEVSSNFLTLRHLEDGEPHEQDHPVFNSVVCE